MQRVYIGTRVMQGAIERYAKKFNLLELRVDPQKPVSSRTLNRWRKSVPPTFAFSVVLPSIVADLRSSKQADEALDLSLQTAALLQSPVVLIANPTSVTPTASNRAKLERLVRRLPHDVTKIAWEPAGLWEPETSRRIAANLGLLLVGDASKESVAPGSVAYTRIRGLGDYRRLSVARIDKMVERLRGYRELFVVVETDGPAAIASAIRAAATDDGIADRVPRARYVEYQLQAEDEEQE